jgi:hypothetical protein
MNRQPLLDTQEMTRRRFVKAGGSGVAAAFLFLHPWASAATAANSTTSDAPAYLRRSSYTALTDVRFSIAGTAVQLQRVDDLAAAQLVPALQNSDDAFSLVFGGPGVDRIPDGIQRVRHSQLGTFELSVGHVNRPGQDQPIEAVINRLPRKAQTVAPAQTASAAPSGAATPPGPPPAPATPRGLTRPKPPIGQITVKRTRRGLTVAVDVGAATDVVQLAVWLKRGRHLVAAGARGATPHRRTAIALSPAKRLRRGRYEIDVIAIHADGEQTAKSKRLTLR